MKEQQVFIHGLNINYKTSGERPTILVLPGWGDNSDHWREFSDSCVQQNIKAIVLDLPGFGKSSHPQKPWNLNDYRDFVKNFIKELGLMPVYLLGHSFGGRIAIKFAAEYPEYLSGLILAASAGVTPRNKLRIFIYFLFSKIGYFIFSLPILSIFRPLMRKVIYYFAQSHDYYKADGAMKETFKAVIPENLTSYLRAISTPTLILWGQDDKMTPVSDAHLLHKNIKNSKLRVIPNAAHGLNRQVPKELAREIKNFVCE